MFESLIGKTAVRIHPASRTSYWSAFSKDRERVWVFAERKVEKGDNAFLIEFEDGTVCYFWHIQDYCEGVEIEDIVGDMDDLMGSPIVRFEARSQKKEYDEETWESGTWTFYELATNKGSVTIRWLGTSNGYYSEEVDCRIFDKNEHELVYTTAEEYRSLKERD